MTSLTEMFIEIINSLIEDRDFELPIYMVSLGANASLVYSRFSRAENGTCQTEELAAHVEGPGFAVPIRLIFLDAEGQIARVDLEEHGQQEYTIQ